MKSEFNLATVKVVFVVWISLMLVFGMTLFSLGWRKQLFIQFSGYLKPPPLDSQAFHILYIIYMHHICIHYTYYMYALYMYVCMYYICMYTYICMYVYNTYKETEREME